MDYQKELGKAIKKVRMQRKMTIQDLHYTTRISHQGIAKIERGDVW